MPLTTIFVIRHAVRSSWTTNRRTGEISAQFPPPTGVPADAVLTAYGQNQARELGTVARDLRPKVARIFSSPWYRCIQTIEPFAKELGQQVILDRGLSEWFGTAPWEHPSPAPLADLQDLFPDLTLSERGRISAPGNGEYVEELHTRIALALEDLITTADRELSSTSEDYAIVICAHAAPIICMGRALTGRVPNDIDEVDFHVYTAGISRYVKRELSSAEKDVFRGTLPESGLQTLNGVPEGGVAGGWICEDNCNVQHLQGGGERDWHFHGDESFVDFSAGQPETKVSTGGVNPSTSKI